MKVAARVLEIHLAGTTTYAIDATPEDGIGRRAAACCPHGVPSGGAVGRRERVREEPLSDLNARCFG
jgi:hypothetical protein